MKRLPVVSTDMTSIHLPIQYSKVFNNLYIYIDPESINQEQWVRKIKIITNVPTTNGIYLWVYAEKDGRILLYITKPQTIFEIGTKHIHMINRIKPDNVFMAGEYKKDNTQLLFNFASGTYMNESVLTNKTSINYMRRVFTHQTRHQNIVVRYDPPILTTLDRECESYQAYVPPTFLRPELLPVTLKDVHHYIEGGAVIYQFRTISESTDFYRKMEEYKSKLKMWKLQSQQHTHTQQQLTTLYEKQNIRYEEKPFITPMPIKPHGILFS